MCSDSGMDEVGINDECESLSESEDFLAGDNEMLTGVSEDASVPDYVCLGPDELIHHMSQLINDVYQVIPLPKTIIRLLLDHFMWDKDSLIESYFEKNNARLFAKARIMPSFIVNDSDLPSLKLISLEKMLHDSRQRSNTDIMACDICCMPSRLINMLAVGCKHFFCHSCWVNYLTLRIMEENQSDRIFCPAYKCENLVDDDSVLSLIQASPVRKRFQKLITNSFVLQNRTLTWCPGIDCGHATRSFIGCESRQIVCLNCSESFCFSCGNTWHEPVLCMYLKLWLKKIDEDSGTSQWLAVNTKECPKCKVTIEKNGGCNHMVCKNFNCKYEFCWICMDLWQPHGSQWYTCNRFDETAVQKTKDNLALSRIALERYLFYFNRYANHAQSRKFETKLYESVQQRMDELQNQGMSWIDVKIVKQVVDVLCQCRRTLMYTYVFAYFLKKNNQSLIFESNQSDLEQATEQLSEFFQLDLTTTDLSVLKQKLQDKSRYCENRRRVLLDHVREGYEKDMWEHIQC